MSRTAELIAVGTELLLGNIVNTDAQMISQGLSAVGINVFYHTVVGDNPARLRSAVEVARKRADIIITTGGLGPTCDDLTKQALADAFGLEMVFDQEAADRCIAFFQRLHPSKPMTKNNLQQAYLPAGCTIFQNDWGTAPGCGFEVDGTHVLMLPGPPRECKAMFTHRALPYLAPLVEGTIASRTLHIFGMGESTVESILREKMNTMENPTLAPYAKEGEVELRITAKATTQAEALALIAPVEAELATILGDYIYGTDVEGLHQVVLDALKDQGLTLGTAESCTGGMVSARLTQLPGASQVIKGGIVSYTNEVKTGVLGVDQAVLDTQGAVSREVATQMAQGIRRVLGCDLGIAVTGLAGPDGDGSEAPVGRVYVALAGPDFCHVRELTLATDRGRVRDRAVLHALDLTRRQLLSLRLKTS